METERKLVKYICESNFKDIPPEPSGVIKNMVLTVLGTTIAGARAEGCEQLVNLYRGSGGAAEATILNYGGKIPAENAALVNGVMARALDFCDAVEPGLHIGDNLRVNAQFSLQYCVANALIRKSSKLHHFEESSVRDPDILPLAQKVRVIADPALNARGHTALDMQVFTTAGDTYLKKMDIAPGFPGNPLTQAEHEARFWDCVNFAARPVEKQAAEKIISLVTRLEQLEDIRILIPLIGS